MILMSQEGGSNPSDQFYNLTTVASWIHTWHATYPQSKSIGFVLSKEYYNILLSAGMEAIRFYYMIDPTGSVRLLGIGVTAAGEDDTTQDANGNMLHAWMLNGNETGKPNVLNERSTPIPGNPLNDPVTLGSGSVWAALGVQWQESAYFQDPNYGGIHSLWFNLTDVQTLLNLGNVAGTRLYFAIGPSVVRHNDPTLEDRHKLVMTPIDSEGNDIIDTNVDHEIYLDFARPCPPHCGGATFH